jgi:hypothetical protein
LGCGEVFGVILVGSPSQRTGSSVHKSIQMEMSFVITTTLASSVRMASVVSQKSALCKIPFCQLLDNHFVRMKF